MLYKNNNNLMIKYTRIPKISRLTFLYVFDKVEEAHCSCLNSIRLGLLRKIHFDLAIFHRYSYQREDIKQLDLRNTKIKKGQKFEQKGFKIKATQKLRLIIRVYN